jgi:hypothetical protein
MQPPHYQITSPPHDLQFCVIITVKRFQNKNEIDQQTISIKVIWNQEQNSFRPLV